MSSQLPHSLLPLPFRCISSRDGAHAVRVEASGELDLAGKPQLERALREAAASAQTVVLDLQAVTFMDSNGLHAIEDASVRALLDGRRLVVTRAPEHVVRILFLTGISCSVELDVGDRYAA